MPTLSANFTIPADKTSLTAQEYRDLVSKEKPKQNKHRNKKIETEDGKFDSIKEYKDWCTLKLRERAGEIHDLKRSQIFELFPKGRTKSGKAVIRIKYTADFTYVENGHLVVVDSKAINKKTKKFILTAAYRRTKKLMFQVHGIEIREM